MRNVTRTFWVTCMVALAGLTACQSEDPAGALSTAPKNPAALVKVGDVDDALMARLRAWAQDNLAIPVPMGEARPADGEDFDTLMAKLAEGLKPEDMGVVAVFDPKVDHVTSHGVYDPARRVVIVNLRAMRGPASDGEAVARRMERQVIRGLGMLMGLESSPNPESAMAPYGSLEELDAIGRNLDPPWLLRLQERAVREGITVDRESPYCLLPQPAAE